MLACTFGGTFPQASHITRDGAFNMTVERTVTAATAGITGASGWLIQAATTPTVGPYMSLIVPAIAAVVGGAVAWGVMQANHKAMDREVQKLSKLMFDVNERVARIEGKLSV